jgi:D-alanyl-D-alanine carboxypeptidase
VEVASLTKIMTCLLSIHIAQSFKLNIMIEKVNVSEKASKMPGTSGGLKYSDVTTVY